jgi:hypothetical protein
MGNSHFIKQILISENHNQNNLTACRTQPDTG